MSELSDVVKYGYDHNTYNITRSNILQQDRYFIEAGFERMIQNSMSYLEDAEFISKILDLGCGNGVPYTRELTNLGKVVGCDISDSQVRRARYNVPRARFICKDVVSLSLKHKYDMITMFNSFYNVADKDKSLLLSKIRYWLKDYGVILITTYGGVTEVKCTECFYGEPMIWHHISAADFEKLVTQAGLCVVDHEYREDTIGSKKTHLWTLEKIESQKGWY